MRLLRLISWPYLRRHLLRWLLTVAGIVLGVAVFVGMHTANQAVLYGFQRTVDRVAGATQLQISAGEAGFDEQVLDRVQAVREVRVAVPIIEAVVDTRLPGQGSLLVLGVDMTGDRSLREYDLESGDDAIIDDPLVFLAQPDSLLVTKEFADRNTLAVDSRLPLWTMAGEKAFVVRGLMRGGGLASAFGGDIAIMDVYAAQLVFGRGRKFDRIDVALKEGVSLAEGRASLRRVLGPGLQIEPPSGRGAQFEAMVRSYSITITVSSLFAVFIGMFIIYNAFAIAVTQRRSEIGILRALGATRGQIRRLFLTESAVTGLVGSIGGLVVGTMLARAIAAYIGDLLGEVYGVAQRAEELSADTRIVALALAMGVVTSMIAALVPARNASRIDPVRALQKGKYQVISAGENRARRLAAATLAAVAVGCLLLGRSVLVFYGGYVLAIVAALLLTPLLAVALVRVLRPALRRLWLVEGTLAADSLIQAPRRTSATVAALMLSLALVMAFAGMAQASYSSILDWITAALNPDLFVTPSENLTSRTFHFPATMGDELKRTPGIRIVQPVRSTRVTFRQTPVMVVATDVASVAQTARRKPVAGDVDEMYRLAAEGRGVVVSDSLAKLQRLRLGEVLELPAPAGLLRLPIVGVIVDYSDQQGSLLMDRAVFQRYWRDDRVDVFRVYLEAGAVAADVKRAILEKFGRDRRVFVFTNAELRRYITRIADQWFGLTYVQIAVALLVAVLGIVNTLTVSIADRRRELGVLQAVGGLRRQVRHTIWIEALTIGLLGVVLGLALGAVNLYYVLEIVDRDIAGMRLDYQFPWTTALALLPTILAAALLSALWPAEAAVRVSLVEALEYE